ncbi:glycosyltransferase family 4 protein [uncultured Microbacterium sp.]|uniref:glycosyltransferase family 4 protein n=1 Tax=uncultured Microbacterium sp. TaxID=191216 RepID=UPI002607E07D|nr:glycosyltransferase family 4 protein [uncultured Microbacterium sp.]
MMERSDDVRVGRLNDDRVMAPASLSGSRIAILVQNLPVPFDRRVWQEATSLAAAGADVTVVCPSDERHPVGDFVIDGVTVHRYLAPREAKGVAGYVNEYGVSLRRMSAVFEKARREKPFDIVHFCNPPDLLYLVARPAQRTDGSILVFDQHDIGPELVAAKKLPLPWLFRTVARHFERRTYRWADHVISTNESYRAIARGRGGFDGDDVTVVRSGPYRSWAAYRSTGEDWHRGRSFLLGYVGVMGRQEGIEYLIDAVAILVSERHLDVHLALIGSGPDRERLENIARTRGVADRVEFHGRVPDEQMKSILSDADVCVNPDEVNPMNDLSTMNKIIEYMALGRPIVQFDVREGRYSAQDASLYAVPANQAQSFADAVEQVLSEPERAAVMGAAGRARFEQVLCWEIQAEKLTAAYAQLMAERSRRSVAK